MDIQLEINKIARVLINDVDNKDILLRSVAELADITDEICFCRGIRKNSKGFWKYSSKLAPKRLDGKTYDFSDDNVSDDGEPSKTNDIDNNNGENDSDDDEDLLEPIKKRERIEPDIKLEK